jgi:hypothetical protein
MQQLWPPQFKKRVRRLAREKSPKVSVVEAESLVDPMIAQVSLKK